MKEHHPFFRKDDPTLMSEFMQFIPRVNMYLINQAKDSKYHPSKTRGQSKVKDLTIEEDAWKLSCKQSRTNMPFTDEVFIYYNNVKIWYMRRESKLAPASQLFKTELQRFFWEVAEHFDRGKPWCGPHDYFDKKTGMHYEARYRGTDDRFHVSEYISDHRGNIVWQASCEGGFIV